MNKKFTYDEVREIFKQSGCELLSEIYINSKTRMSYRCNCGNIAKISLAMLQQGQRCNSCRYVKIANSMKLDFEYVKEYFTQNGCELIEDKYKNARTKIQYRCSCGSISSISFDSFKNGNRCKECGNRKSAEKNRGKIHGNGDSQRLSQEYVMSFLNSKNCKLISAYVNSTTFLDFTCFCGEAGKKTFSSFKKKSCCSKCSLKDRSGENHYEWRKDRISLYYEKLFKQRCYKLVAMSLKATGRVKNGKTARLLGYTFKELQDHIINHPNYNLVKNDRWNIDHIFPIKAFVDYGIENLSLINCLENLRPISMVENCSKSDHYDRSEFEGWLKLKGAYND